MKLRGTPWWTSDGAEVNQARLLGCNVLSALDAQGFELVASVDMSIGVGKEHRDCKFDNSSMYLAMKLNST